MCTSEFLFHLFPGPTTLTPCTCSKACKILGMIFHHFYHHSSIATIICFYSSLVWPILEYCSVVWNPSSCSLSDSLESVQSFALKLASKFHPSLIPSIIHQFSISSLSSRWRCAKLITLFKFHHGFLQFPSPLLLHPLTPSYPFRSYHPANFIIFSLKLLLSHNPISPLLFLSGTLSHLKLKTLFPYPYLNSKSISMCYSHSYFICSMY